MEAKKVLHAKSANIRNSSVKSIRMPYKLDTSANILQKRAIENNIQVEQTRRSLKRSQTPMVDGRAEGDASETMDNMVVENLIHVDQNSIFKGQQLILLNISLLQFLNFPL